MAFELGAYELEKISTNLPPQYAALKDKYPMCVWSAADYWDFPPYPKGYVPRFIDIFYRENTSRSDVTIEKGVITHADIEGIASTENMYLIAIEDEPAYIRVERWLILNRMDGVILPEILTNRELWLRGLSKFVPVN